MTTVMPLGMLCLCSLLLVLVLPAAVHAVGTAGAVLYVDKGNPNCSDTGSGTVALPFCTIGAAATQATGGTTVQVAAGTYNEQVSPKSGAANNPVIFVGAVGATVTGNGTSTSRGFYLSSRSWVTIQGFTITSTGSDGLYVSKSSRINLIGNHVSFSGQPISGKTARGITVTTTNDSLVKDNIVDHNSSYGIYVASGSTRNQVVGNVISFNASVYSRLGSGIRLHSSPGNTISSNVSHDNEDSGIELVSSSNSNLVVNNVAYRNGDHGIDNLDSGGTRIVSNSVYNNVTAGINVEGTSTGAMLANNISVDNGINSPRTSGNIRVDSSSTSGTTIDFDLVKLRTTGTMIEWSGTSYATLAAFVAARGQEARGIQADPNWASPANGNFHLTSGSPAIDSANSGASGHMATDVEGRARVDEPSAPNTGSGPRAYDDRGAYEFDAVQLDHIVISPSTSTIAAGASQTYTAQGFDASNNSLGDVTASTTFSISPNGSCSANVCTATASGSHTVTGNNAGKTSTAALSVTAGPLDRLVLSPASATVASGGSQAYTAEGRDQYDNSLGDLTAGTTFSITPNGSCSGATCTASVAGAHTVTGTNGGKSGTASLQVSAGSLNHIVISPSSATIAAGASQTYTAQGFDAVGNSVGDVTAFTTFSISPNGLCSGNACTATAAGAHTVTGNDGGKTSTAVLTVTAGPLDHLVLSPASATIAAGGSQAYTAEGRDQYENPLGAVTASTTFSIAPDGSCTGATCTASVTGAHTVTGTNGGKTGTASLQVSAGPLDRLVLSPASATVASGGSQAYTAEGRDQYDNSLGDLTAGTTFSISPDGSCTGATCTASLAGAHTVTGTNGGKTGTASLEIAASSLDHIVVSPASATIGAGGSQGYTAEGFDASNNSIGDVTAFTTFSIAPDGSCIGATCTATASGLHTVTGNNAGKTSTAALSVTAGSLDHLALSPASATIAAGGSQAYTAEGRDQYDNSLGDLTAGTTFSIAPNGSCSGATCTASLAGAHTVTGTNGGKTGTASLQVEGGTVDHIVVSPASATIAAGGSQTYTAEGFDAANNSLGDVTGSTTFSISPNGSCSGNVCTATASGSHTVTGNNAGKTSTAALSVTAGPLDRLVLSPASATIAAGGSQAYTAEGRDQYDNSLGDLTAGTTFSITPNGSCSGATCTATVTGAHTVTGTNGGKTGTASLQVTAGTVLDHIVIRPASATIAAGGSQTYTAEGFDASNNSLGDVTGSTTFSISPNGSCSGNVCTATASGSHTVTGNNAGKTSTAALSVTAGSLDHLALSPASATIAAGGSQAYTAEGRDQYDNPLGDLTAGTTFSITPNGSCSAATCTATVTGAHTVTGTNGGKTGTASLQVGAGALARIVISPASATIAAGGSQTYTAEGFDASNNSIGDVTAFTTFSIAPEGSCTGNVCVANAGGAHTVTGSNNGKTNTAQLSVSFVRNPGFEADTSGWNSSGSSSGVTLTRVAGGHSGGWAAKITNTSAVAAGCTLNDSPNWVLTTSPGTYVATLWARADVAGAVLKLRFREYSGSTLSGSGTTQVTLTTEWQQVTLTYTVVAAGASTLDYNAYISSAAPGTCFYADDAAIFVP